MAKSRERGGQRADQQVVVARKKTYRKKKTSPTFKVYIHRVMKNIDKDARISPKAMSVMSSFCDDIFKTMSSEIARLASARKTVMVHDVLTATRLILPPELSKHAVSEATKAVATFEKNSA